MQKHNRKPSTQLKTPKTLEKKKKNKTVAATQVIVSQHKAQARSGPPKSQPEVGTSASAASGNNVSVSSFLAKFEMEIWNFNGNFVPYALASLGPAMAEGGAVHSNRERLILAIAVEMGLLSDESVIRETPMSNEDRDAYKVRMKKQKILLQTVDQVCVPFIFVLLNAFTYLPLSEFDVNLYESAGDSRQSARYRKPDFYYLRHYFISTGAAGCRAVVDGNNHWASDSSYHSWASA
jgi:hypothetical protein